MLIIDGDILSRHAIADYLRHCGYAVVEAANTDEAFLALGEVTLSIDVIVCDIASLPSADGFELAKWVRQNRPELKVKLAGGVEKAAQVALELCEGGPHLKRPYEPEAIIDYVKRLRATKLAGRAFAQWCLRVHQSIQPYSHPPPWQATPSSLKIGRSQIQAAGNTDSSLSKCDSRPGGPERSRARITEGMPQCCGRRLSLFPNVCRYGFA